MNATEKINPINALNLDAIKAALMDKQSGAGWSLNRATAVEFEYRRFLCLMQMFPDEHVAPLVDVDTFWHCHILNTMKYAADCEQIFGYFLHHVPSSGTRDEHDHAVHQRTGARMQELYEATFGEAYIRPHPSDVTTASPQAASADAAWCAAAMPTAAWCAPGAAKAAWCAPEAAKAAWCAPGAAKAAWCVPEAAKAAWCVPEAAKAAWCAPAAPKAAWCAPATPRATAWCAPASPNMGWLQGAQGFIKKTGAAPANADRYSLQPSVSFA